MKNESLPKIGTLSRLAAQLYVPVSGQDSVSNAVKLAGEIWLECQSYINAKNEEGGCKISNNYPYDQPIKIENHFMPRVDSEFLNKTKVSRDELLKAVVGLSKMPDRLKMFRDFLCVVREHLSAERFESMGLDFNGDSDPYEPMSDEQHNRFFKSMSEIFDGTELNKPEPTPRPDVEMILTSLRKYGTKSHHAILKNFREWRIWESIPSGKDHEYSEILNKALKKGLEHEELLKNGTQAYGGRNYLKVSVLFM